MDYCEQVAVEIVEASVDIIKMLINLNSKHAEPRTLSENYSLFRGVRRCGFAVEVESVKT